jgi:fibronectin-binding autotransporter adhesin
MTASHVVYLTGRVRLIFTALILVVAPLVLRAQVVIPWGNGNASWNVGGNWSGGNVPGNADTAQIGGGVASVDSNATVAKLTLSGGNIAGSAVLTVTGAGSTWTGGSMNGNGTVKFGSAASLTISGSNDHDLQGRAIVNEGSVTWSVGALRGGDGSTFTNAAGATFTATANGYSAYNPWGGTFVFANQGTFSRSGVGNTEIGTTFNNTGAVNVTGGRLTLHSGGTSSGTFSVSGAGSDLVIDNGYALTHGATLSGAVRFTGGTLTASGTINASGFTFEGGDLDGTHTFAGGPIEWKGGSWSESSTGSTTTIASTATLNLTTTSEKVFQRRAIINEGTTTWSGGNFRSADGGTFTNAASGIFEDSNASGDTYIYNGIGGSFVFANNGQFKKTGAATTHVQVPFNNNQSVAVNAGQLSLEGGGTTSGTGVFNTATGAVLAFNADYTIANGASLTGTGIHKLQSGALTINGAFGVSTFLQTGGTLAGSHTINGSYEWAGGTWASGANGPSTTIALGSTLDLTTSSEKNFQRRAIVNEGTINWWNGTFRSADGGTFTNRATGLFEDKHASGDAYIYNGIGGSFVFTNDGQFKKIGGATTHVQVPFDNNKTVTVNAGQLSLEGGGTTSGTGVFATAADAITAFNSDYTIANGAALTGAGAYKLLNGALTINGAVNVGAFAQLGGTLAGTQTLSGTYQWTGGTWASGTNGFSTTIASGATLNLGTTSEKNFQRRAIINEGTVNWEGGGNFRSADGGTFRNKLGGLFEDKHTSGDAYIYNGIGGTFVFTNDGHFKKSGAAATHLQTTFNNNKDVTVAAGQLWIEGGGTTSGTGVFNTAQDATTFFNSDYTITSGASLMGAGAYRLVNGALSIGGTINVTAFTQAGGTLAGTQTFNGTYNWNGGTWASGADGLSTTIASGSTLNLGTTSEKNFQRRAIINEGTVNWEGGGTFRSADGGTFRNKAGSLFEDKQASGDAYIYNGIGGTFIFTNDGHFKKTGAAATHLQTTFNNNKDVTVAAGQLWIEGGGTTSGTGVFNTAAGATTYFNSDYTISDGASLTGLGAYRLAAGALSVGGAVNVSTFSQTGGTLAGTQKFNGIYNWEGGQWVTGTSGQSTTIGLGSTLNLSTTSEKNFQRRAIINEGTVNWQGGGTLRSADGGSFTNKSTGLFQDRQAGGEAYIYNGIGGTFVFTNEGHFHKTGGATTRIQTTFDNFYRVTVEAGELWLEGGGTNASAGVFNTFAQAFTFFNADYGLNDGSLLSGPGAYRLLNGALTLNGLIGVGNFEQTGGTLAGSHTINGNYTWSGGSWATGATGLSTTVTAGSFLNLTTSSEKNFQRRSVINQGTVTWSGGHLRSADGGQFTNDSTGIFLDQSSTGATIYNGIGGTFTFTNKGSYLKTGANTTAIQVPFTNNNGSITVSAGVLHFADSFTHSSGSIAVMNGATVRFDNGLNLVAGALIGNGTVEGNVTNQGSVLPGIAAGRLNITGNLTLLGTSTLLFELGGLGQGVSFDFLSVTGTGALAGNLHVTFLDGFQWNVQSTDTFTIFTANAGLAGTFGNAPLSGQRISTGDGAATFRVHYGPNSVVLSEFIVAVPEPSTYVLLGMGGVLVLLTYRRRK